MVIKKCKKEKTRVEANNRACKFEEKLMKKRLKSYKNV